MAENGSGVPRIGKVPERVEGGHSLLRSGLAIALVTIILAAGTNVLGVWSTPWQKAAQAERLRLEEVAKARAREEAQRRQEAIRRQETARRQAEVQRKVADRRLVEEKARQREAQRRSAEQALAARAPPPAVPLSPGTAKPPSASERATRDKSFPFSDETAKSIRDLTKRLCSEPVTATKLTIEGCGNAIADEPRNAYLYYVRGQMHGLQGAIRESIEDFSKAIEIEPRDPRPYALRALAYTKIDKPDEALADYGRAIEQQAKIQQSYVNLVTMHMSRGDLLAVKRDFAVALAEIEKAIQLGPRVPAPYESLARVRLEASGDHRRAIVDFGKAIELAPGKADLYRARARSHTVLADHPAAVADLKRATELAPNDVKHWLGLGVAYAAAGRRADAIAALERALELEPGNGEVQQTLKDLRGSP